MYHTDVTAVSGHRRQPLQQQTKLTTEPVLERRVVAVVVQAMLLQLRMVAHHQMR